MSVRVILYTKPGCHLCEEMKAQIRGADCDELYTLEEFNIENDPAIFACYQYEIPVLWIDGVDAFRHKLSAQDFRSYVTSLAQSD